MAHVRVAVRVRPLNAREKKKGARNVIAAEGDSLILQDIRVPQASGCDHRARFKRFLLRSCFLPNDESEAEQQEQVYSALGPGLLEDVLAGYNCCLIAYGQSGSGKTYTMLGKQECPGMMPRLCEELLEKLPLLGSEATMELSCVELYNESLRDLLSARTGQLRVREHPKTGPYVQDLGVHRVTSAGELRALLWRGMSRRQAGATLSNTRSSRSHALLTLQLQRGSGAASTHSKLHLVDLAGSERAGEHQLCPRRLKEGASINRSLVALGNVISALAEQSRRSSDATPNSLVTPNCGSRAPTQHSPSSLPPSSPHLSARPLDRRRRRGAFVSYRSSVLTWLLKDSLGGNSKTVMIAAVSPASSCYSDTLSTLRFAERAAAVVTRPVAADAGGPRVVQELRREVDRLRRLLTSHQMSVVSGVQPAEDRTGSDRRRPCSEQALRRSRRYLQSARLSVSDPELVSARVGDVPLASAGHTPGRRCRDAAPQATGRRRLTLARAQATELPEPTPGSTERPSPIGAEAAVKVTPSRVKVTDQAKVSPAASTLSVTSAADSELWDELRGILCERERRYWASYLLWERRRGLYRPASVPVNMQTLAEERRSRRQVIREVVQRLYPGGRAMPRAAAKAAPARDPGEEPDWCCCGGRKRLREGSTESRPYEKRGRIMDEAAEMERRPLSELPGRRGSQSRPLDVSTRELPKLEPRRTPPPLLHEDEVIAETSFSEPNISRHLQQRESIQSEPLADIPSGRHGSSMLRASSPRGALLSRSIDEGLGGSFDVAVTSVFSDDSLDPSDLGLSRDSLEMIDADSVEDISGDTRRAASGKKAIDSMFLGPNHGHVVAAPMIITPRTLRGKPPRDTVIKITMRGQSISSDSEWGSVASSIDRHCSSRTVRTDVRRRAERRLSNSGASDSEDETRFMSARPPLVTDFIQFESVRQYRETLGRSIETISMRTAEEDTTSFESALDGITFEQPLSATEVHSVYPAPPVIHFPSPPPPEIVVDECESRSSSPDQDSVIPGPLRRHAATPEECDDLGTSSDGSGSRESPSPPVTTAPAEQCERRNSRDLYTITEVVEANIVESPGISPLSAGVDIDYRRREPASQSTPAQAPPPAARAADSKQTRSAAAAGAPLSCGPHADAWTPLGLNEGAQVCAESIYRRDEGRVRRRALATATAAAGPAAGWVDADMWERYVSHLDFRSHLLLEEVRRRPGIAVSLQVRSQSLPDLCEPPPPATVPLGGHVSRLYRSALTVTVPGHHHPHPHHHRQEEQRTEALLISLPAEGSEHLAWCSDVRPLSVPHATIAEITEAPSDGGCGGGGRGYDEDDEDDRAGGGGQDKTATEVEFDPTVVILCGSTPTDQTLSFDDNTPKLGLFDSLSLSNYPLVPAQDSEEGDDNGGIVDTPVALGQRTNEYRTEFSADVITEVTSDVTEDQRGSVTSERTIDDVTTHVAVQYAGAGGGTIHQTVETVETTETRSVTTGPRILTYEIVEEVNVFVLGAGETRVSTKISEDVTSRTLDPATDKDETTSTTSTEKEDTDDLTGTVYEEPAPMVHSYHTGVLHVPPSQRKIVTSVLDVETRRREMLSGMLQEIPEEAPTRTGTSQAASDGSQPPSLELWQEDGAAQPSVGASQTENDPATPGLEALVSEKDTGSPSLDAVKSDDSEPPSLDPWQPESVDTADVVPVKYACGSETTELEARDDLGLGSACGEPLKSDIDSEPPSLDPWSTGKESDNVELGLVQVQSDSELPPLDSWLAEKNGNKTSLDPSQSPRDSEPPNLDPWQPEYNPSTSIVPEKSNSYSEPPDLDPWTTDDPYLAGHSSPKEAPTTPTPASQPSSAGTEPADHLNIAAPPVVDPSGGGTPLLRVVTEPHGSPTNARAAAPSVADDGTPSAQLFSGRHEMPASGAEPPSPFRLITNVEDSMVQISTSEDRLVTGVSHDPPRPATPQPPAHDVDNAHIATVAAPDETTSTAGHPVKCDPETASVDDGAFANDRPARGNDGEPTVDSDEHERAPTAVTGGSEAGTHAIEPQSSSDSPGISVDADDDVTGAGVDRPGADGSDMTGPLEMMAAAGIDPDDGQEPVDGGSGQIDATSQDGQPQAIDDNDQNIEPAASEAAMADTESALDITAPQQPPPIFIFEVENHGSLLRSEYTKFIDIGGTVPPYADTTVGEEPIPSGSLPTPMKESLFFFQHTDEEVSLETIEEEIVEAFESTSSSSTSNSISKNTSRDVEGESLRSDETGISGAYSVNRSEQADDVAEEGVEEEGDSPRDVPQMAADQLEVTAEAAGDCKPDQTHEYIEAFPPESTDDSNEENDSYIVSPVIPPKPEHASEDIIDQPEKDVNPGSAPFTDAVLQTDTSPVNISETESSHDPISPPSGAANFPVEAREEAIHGADSPCSGALSHPEKSREPMYFSPDSHQSYDMSLPVWSRVADADDPGSPKSGSMSYPVSARVGILGDPATSSESSAVQADRELEEISGRLDVLSSSALQQFKAHTEDGKEVGEQVKPPSGSPVLLATLETPAGDDAGAGDRQGDIEEGVVETPVEQIGLEDMVDDCSKPLENAVHTASAEEDSESWEEPEELPDFELSPKRATLAELSANEQELEGAEEEVEAFYDCNPRTVTATLAQLSADEVEIEELLEDEADELISEEDAPDIMRATLAELTYEEQTLEDLCLEEVEIPAEFNSSPISAVLAERSSLERTTEEPSWEETDNISDHIPLVVSAVLSENKGVEEVAEELTYEESLPLPSDVPTVLSATLDEQKPLEEEIVPTIWEEVEEVPDDNREVVQAILLEHNADEEEVNEAVWEEVQLIPDHAPIVMTSTLSTLTPEEKEVGNIEWEEVGPALDDTTIVMSAVLREYSAQELELEDTVLEHSEPVPDHAPSPEKATLAELTPQEEEVEETIWENVEAVSVYAPTDMTAALADLTPHEEDREDTIWDETKYKSSDASEVILSEPGIVMSQEVEIELPISEEVQIAPEHMPLEMRAVLAGFDPQEQKLDDTVWGEIGDLQNTVPIVMNVALVESTPQEELLSDPEWDEVKSLGDSSTSETVVSLPVLTPMLESAEEPQWEEAHAMTRNTKTDTSPGAHIMPKISDSTGGETSGDPSTDVQDTALPIADETVSTTPDLVRNEQSQAVEASAEAPIETTETAEQCVVDNSLAGSNAPEEIVERLLFTQTGLSDPTVEEELYEHEEGTSVTIYHGNSTTTGPILEFSQFDRTIEEALKDAPEHDEQRVDEVPREQEEISLPAEERVQLDEVDDGLADIMSQVVSDPCKVILQCRSESDNASSYPQEAPCNPDKSSNEEDESSESTCAKCFSYQCGSENGGAMVESDDVNARENDGEGTTSKASEDQAEDIETEKLTATEHREPQKDATHRGVLKSEQQVAFEQSVTSPDILQKQLLEEVSDGQTSSLDAFDSYDISTDGEQEIFYSFDNDDHTVLEAIPSRSSQPTREVTEVLDVFTEVEISMNLSSALAQANSEENSSDTSENNTPRIATGAHQDDDCRTTVYTDQIPGDHVEAKIEDQGIIESHSPNQNKESGDVINSGVSQVGVDQADSTPSVSTAVSDDPQREGHEMPDKPVNINPLTVHWPSDRGPSIDDDESNYNPSSPPHTLRDPKSDQAPTLSTHDPDDQIFLQEATCSEAVSPIADFSDVFVTSATILNSPQVDTVSDVSDEAIDWQPTPARVRRPVPKLDVRQRTSLVELDGSVSPREALPTPPTARPLRTITSTLSDIHESDGDGHDEPPPTVAQHGLARLVRYSHNLGTHDEDAWLERQDEEDRGSPTTGAPLADDPKVRMWQQFVELHRRSTEVEEQPPRSRPSAAEADVMYFYIEPSGMGRSALAERGSTSALSDVGLSAAVPREQHREPAVQLERATSMESVRPWGSQKMTPLPRSCSADDISPLDITTIIALGRLHRGGQESGDTSPSGGDRNRSKKCVSWSDLHGTGELEEVLHSPEDEVRSNDETASTPTSRGADSTAPMSEESSESGSDEDDLHRRHHQLQQRQQESFNLTMPADVRQRARRYVAADPRGSQSRLETADWDLIQGRKASPPPQQQNLINASTQTACDASSQTDINSNDIASLGRHGGELPHRNWIRDPYHRFETNPAYHTHDPYTLHRGYNIQPPPTNYDVTSSFNNYSTTRELNRSYEVTDSSHHGSLRPGVRPPHHDYSMHSVHHTYEPHRLTNYRYRSGLTDTSRPYPGSDRHFNSDPTSSDRHHISDYSSSSLLGRRLTSDVGSSSLRAQALERHIRAEIEKLRMERERGRGRYGGEDFERRRRLQQVELSLQKSLTQMRSLLERRRDRARVILQTLPPYQPVTREDVLITDLPSFQLLDTEMTSSAEYDVTHGQVISGEPSVGVNPAGVTQILHQEIRVPCCAGHVASPRRRRPPSPQRMPPSQYREHLTNIRRKILGRTASPTPPPLKSARERVIGAGEPRRTALQSDPWGSVDVFDPVTRSEPDLTQPRSVWRREVKASHSGSEGDIGERLQSTDSDYVSTELERMRFARQAL